ncbi:hypothetical protein [Pseudomonas sp. dw_358]|uniref:hypothetical protein n=1 Tax=Pseudomonas sp. dw_358 TaxID=2720083 RepID=UPI001BD65F8B|nr:hypothetical protein [Pseudomonas sp. dw_358]
MFSIYRQRITAVILSAALVPILIFFYSQLPVLSVGIRSAVSSVLVIFIGIVLWITFKALRLPTPTALAIVVSSGLVGFMLSPAVRVQAPGADNLSMHYSDGAIDDRAQPSAVSLWGDTMNAVFMHPAFSNAKVPNVLIGTFDSTPSNIRVYFTKPEAGMFKDDGSLTDSDGISVKLTAYDSTGHAVPPESFYLSEQEFLSKKWIARNVTLRSGISKVELAIGTGPPGSTPDYDSTYVAFEIPSALVSVERVGKVLVLCLAVLVIILVGYLNVKKKSSPVSCGMKWTFLDGLKVGVLPLICLGIAYWSHVNTTFVFFWDFLNYWDKTQVLYNALHSSSWAEAVGLFTSSYTADYSFLPAVAPATLDLLVGFPTRLCYVMTIILIYAVPAYLSLALLSRRLVERKTYPEGAAETWIVAGLPILLGLPLYFGTALYLMPDIGGVALVVVVLLLSTSLVESLNQPCHQHASWLPSREIVTLCLTLGLVFSVLFIFRRWYVFSTVGVIATVGVLILLGWWRSPGYRWVYFSKVCLSVCTIAVAMIPFLCWVMFSWSAELGKHNYSTLYASYDYPLSAVIALFVQYFGLFIPVLSLLAFGLFVKLGAARNLLFILAGSTLISVVLFLQIQSPGRHHFYLLMPFLGASLGGVSIFLHRRYGVRATICFCLILVVGNGVNTWLKDQGGRGTTIFSTYDDWLPKQQKYQAGYAAVVSWLNLPENIEKKFCLVASGRTINEGLFLELGQIDPNVKRHEFDTRFVYLAQVDSVDGPPFPSTRECKIFLVADPFQSHLRPEHQSSMRIVQTDILRGEGIGQATHDTGVIFSMGDGIVLRAFEAFRPITDQEYTDLVSRYKKNKADQ